MKNEYINIKDKKKKLRLTTVLFVIAILLGAVLLGSCTTYQVALDSLSEEQKEQILNNRTQINVNPNLNPYLDPWLWNNNPRYWNGWNYGFAPGYGYYGVPRFNYRIRPNNGIRVKPRSSSPRSRSRIHTTPRRSPKANMRPNTGRRSVPKQPMGRKK